MTDPVGEQMSAGTLLLVDGSSYLYRAYHALPDLRSPAGLPTGAIYGVLSMLRRMPSDFKATHCACVFDAKGRTFRDDWYPEYKANRPPMPEDLAQQVAPLHACVRALGWPLLCEPGVEADDVIGTLATQAAAAGFEVIISTGDKDLAQLVTPQVTLINTMTNERLDVAGVEQKFGVPPARIVDYLALVGDSVDNVPGVDKVGPKTAVKWLETYGSLDGIVAAADSIGGKIGENLRAAREFLPLGRRLVTVVCDLPLPVGPTGLAIGEADPAALREHYQALGFRSWLKALDEPRSDGGQTRSDSTPAAEAPVPEVVLDASGKHRDGYATVLDESAFEAWLGRIESAPAVAFDSETTGLNPLRAEIVGLSFALGDGDACYVPLAHRYAGVPEQLERDAVLARLRPWFEDPDAKKIGQNLKYDQHVLANHGITLRGVADDTLLESYVLDAGKDGVRGHDLGELARRHLGLETIAYADLCGKGASQIGFEQVDIERAAAYAAEDADLTWRIHRVLAARLAGEPAIASVYRDIEMPVREVLYRMERNGVLIDADRLARQSHEIGQRLLALEGEAHALAGQPFNLASPKQLGEILFSKLGLPVKKKTPSGGPSTDEEVLTELALDYPLPKLLLEHRSLAKLKGTYTDKLPGMVNADTGRVHTSFSQSTAVTGRLASSDPNLQNIPVRTVEGRKIRAAFVAPAGARIVSADYSQIELRIMAHLSGDERLCEAFDAGEDIHRATAAGIFGTSVDAVGPDQRRVAKVINFGLIYGMSAFGLARELGLQRGAAQAYIEQYFARYPGVAKYMEATRATAHDRGYVETVFGRRLWLPEIRARQQARRQGAERAAINAPMQGTAADLIKLAMIGVQNWLDEARLATRLVLQVHDELVLEVPESELVQVRERLPALMAEVAELRVPLLVDVGVGHSWDEAH